MENTTVFLMVLEVERVQHEGAESCHWGRATSYVKEGRWTVKGGVEEQGPTVHKLLL